MADRWLPEQMNWEYEKYKRCFEKLYMPDFDEDVNLGEYDLGSKKNTSIADYVWLPFRFDGEMGYLDWKDEWRIEDYE